MLKELIEERAKILTQATDIAAKMKADGRDELNTEEQATVDNISKRAVELDGLISKAEEEQRSARASKDRLDNLVRNANRNESRRSAPPQHQRGAKPQRVADTEEYRAFWDARFVGDDDAMWAARQQMEERALSLGTNSAGGFLTLPTALADVLISNIDELSGIASLAETVDIGDAKSMGLPKITARGDDADWTGEITAITPDTSLTFGRRDLTPYMLTKEVLASLVLVQRSPKAQQIVLGQLARLFGVTYEKAVHTGSGTNQPLGLFIASSNGISTARDITTAATTSFTYAKLIELKYNLKAPYLNSPRCRFICHRDFIYRALTLLDDQNRPIFIPASGPGLEDMILGIKIAYSEFAPNTFTAAKYIAVIGDMSYYWMVRGMPYSVQICDQLAARTNQVVFLGRTEMDGAPILEEAFSRLITAAA